MPDGCGLIPFLSKLNSFKNFTWVY